MNRASTFFHTHSHSILSSHIPLTRSPHTQESAVHPDTHELIPRSFRFSAFVPVNIPLVVGMLSSTTPAGTIFWQWANQSYNVAVNYANRNIGGGKEMSQRDIALSYSGAVLSSCSIALGLGKVVERLNQRPNPGYGIRIFRGAVPFFAVASAGVVNVVLMRRGELSTGVTIKDALGTDHGMSQIAGTKAITEVALTRVALPAPILLFPPIIMSLYDRMARAASINTKFRPIVQVPVITACLWLALPFAIGLFPQESSIDANKLEEKFRNLNDKNGRRIETFYFNKGL